MKIKCEKNILLEQVNIVSKAVSSRSTLPILECVLLSVVEGAFKLTSNDLEMAIETAPIPSEIFEEGIVALEAKMFFEIVRRLPEGMVSISTDGNHVTVIKCAKSQFKILGLAGDEFPAMPYVEKTNAYVINAADFKSMVRKTVFAVSIDETKPVMMGELLEIKEGVLHIVAVDGFRLAYCKKPIEQHASDVNMVIPAKTLNELSKILPGDGNEIITLYATDKHVLIETEGYTVVSRVLEGDFIKYEPLFMGDYKTVVTASRQMLVMGLERASLIASKEVKKKPIKFKIEDDLLVISSNAETGNVTDEINVQMDGSALEIAFNPRYLIDALKTIEDDVVSMRFTTPLSPCIIKGEDSDEAKYLVLPLRLQ